MKQRALSSNEHLDESMARQRLPKTMQKSMSQTSLSQGEIDLIEVAAISIRKAREVHEKHMEI